MPRHTVINRRRGVDLRPASRTAPWILAAISLLNLVFLCGMLFGYHPPTELHGVALSIKLLLSTTVMPATLVEGIFLEAYPTRRFQSAWMGIIVHSVQSVFVIAVVLTIVLK